jgi:hypothetical protein
MQSSSLDPWKVVGRGLAAPLKNEVGDIIISLSFVLLAVPVYESIVTPLLILFGSLIALELSIISFPFNLRSSSSFNLFCFSTSIFFLD